NSPDIHDIASRSAWSVRADIDPSSAPHEIGHTAGLDHTTNANTNPYPTGTCGELARKGVVYPPGNTFPFPYYSGMDPLLGPVGDDQLLVFGYDAATDSTAPHTEKALMSYCGTTLWPDIGSYNHLAREFAEAPAKVAAATGT